MKNLLIISIILTFTACSVFQTEEQQKSSGKETNKVEEVYIFDEVSETHDNTSEIKELEKEIDNTLSEDKKSDQSVFDEPVHSKSQNKVGESNNYFLQLGAFTTLKRAEQYVNQIKNQVPFVLSIIYDSETTYYTVRSSSYSTRKEVEDVRTQLWNNNLFKDSFIITE